MYSLYCSNYDNASDLLEKLKDNQEFSKTLAVCMTDSAVKGQNLLSYLIKPIQRICKYPLLFRELISHTPKDHKDYDSLIKVKEEIDKVVSHVNEEKRKTEKQIQMLDIHNSIEGEFESELVVQGRECILEKKITGKIVAKSAKLVSSDSRHENYKLFVFNDLILVTKIVGSNDQLIQTTGLGTSVGTAGSVLSHKPYLLKAFIPISECKITLISDDEKIQNSFDLWRDCKESEEKTIRFQLFSENKKIHDEVFGCIKRLVNDYKKGSVSKPTVK